jgi:hypothetical protein
MVQKLGKTRESKGRVRFMKASRKATVLFLLAAVCFMWQFAPRATGIEPEIASALEVSSSLDQYTKWISDLSGETEAVVYGKPKLILTRYETTAGAETAEDYLREQLYGAGVEVETRPVFSPFGNNVIGHLRGVERPNEVVIVCAHYDSISEDPVNFAPGADDNASGVAGVLTAARVLRNFRLARSVEFCLFAAEEFGLYGSQAYAAECLEEGKEVVGVINMDMIMHPGHDNQPTAPIDADIVTNGASRKLAALLRASMEWYTDVDVEIHVDETRGSDHAPFWDIGAKAIAVTENTPAEIWGGATTVYHTTADVITQQNADLPFGLAVARGVAATAMSLGEWEPVSSLPYGATACVVVDGMCYPDEGKTGASSFAEEGFAPNGVTGNCEVENLVLQGSVTAWAGDEHEAVCHSKTFQTFIPRSDTLADGQEIEIELVLGGGAQFTIEGKLPSLYANSQVEVWGRTVESFPLFEGSVSLSSTGMEVKGDFLEEEFAISGDRTQKEASLSGWADVIHFSGKVGEPLTLCARLRQMAYAGRGGEAACTWTEPLCLSLSSVTSEAWLEVAEVPAAEPEISAITTEGMEVVLSWKPFSEGAYTVEWSSDLLSWTPLDTTPLTTWRGDKGDGNVGFFRVTSP